MNLICFPLGYGFAITLNLASNLPLEWQYLMGLSHPLIVPLKSFPTFFKVNHYGHYPSSHGHIHMYTVLLNNLNPCLNYNFHFKGIKKNVLNNAIDFNFLSWISNAYVYVWQCSYNAFD